MQTKYEKIKGSKVMKILMLCFVVVFIGSVSAIWYFSGDFTTGLIVGGSSEVSFSSNLSVNNLDDTSQVYSKIEEIIINNADGEMDFQFLIIENITDVEDDCSNQDDLNFTLWKDDFQSEIRSLDNLTIGDGETKIFARTRLKQYACPQEISINVLINPV